MHKRALAEDIAKAMTKEEILSILKEHLNPEAIKKLAALRESVMVLKGRYDEKNAALQAEIRKREAETHSLHKEIDDLLSQLATVEQEINEE